MLIKRRWHITWTCTDSPHSHSVSLPVRTGVVLALVVVVFLLGLGAVSAWVLFHRVDNSSMETLQQQNDLLRKNVTRLSARVDSVRARIELMEGWEERIRKDESMQQLNETLLGEYHGEEMIEGEPVKEVPLDDSDDSGI